MPPHPRITLVFSGVIIFLCLWSDTGTAAEYHDYEGVLDALDEAAAAHPDIVAVHDLGSTGEGRLLRAVKISDNVEEDEPEPAILFDGAIHGDEPAGMEVALHLLAMLAEGYGEDDPITGLVDEREIWIVPLVNPEGLEAATRENGDGTDLNRDFGYMWDGLSGSTAPFSAPETRALFALARDEMFVLATSFHSGNEVLVFPWSYTDEPAPDVDGFRALGRGYEILSGYPYHQSASGDYRVIGSSKDSYYGSLGTLAWSLEVSAEKRPEEPDLDAVLARNEQAMLYLIAAAGQGVGGVVVDHRTGKPIPARLEIEPVGWIGYGDRVNGAFHRFLVPGTYDLTFRSPGYEPASVSDVEVTVGETTDVSVDLVREEASPRGAFQLVACTLVPEGAKGDTVDLLGAADGEAFSAPAGGQVVVDTGASFGPADELVVTPGEDASNSGYHLFAAEHPHGPWLALGAGEGVSSFSLAPSDLGEARYVRVVVDADEDSFALDALEIFPAEEPPGPDAGQSDGGAEGGEGSEGSCDCRAAGQVSRSGAVGILTWAFGLL